MTGQQKSAHATLIPAGSANHTIMQSEIRKDYIQDRYVLIAPRRGQRPHDVERPERLHKPAKKDCVFCPEKLRADGVKPLLTIGSARRWQVQVIPNKYPAISLDNPKAYGRQEVVVETSDHVDEIEDLPVAHLVKILGAYVERTRVISRDKKIDYILIFKNDGGAAGASLIHAHSQIFATSFLPPHLRDKSERVHAYRLKTGRCIYCDVIQKERRGPRRVYEDRLMIAFTPYASMHNYEIWIVPKRHIDNITEITAQEKISLSKMLKKILKKISRLNLAYNYYFHQVIHDTDQHLYMKIKPRGSVWAGVEIGSGLIINPVSPEEAAKFYRG